MVAIQLKHTFPFPLYAHAFNKDRTEVAVSPNSNEVYIYKVGKSAGSWQLVSTLSEHDLLVTGIDWAPETDRIVTCSQDKNAYVWERDTPTTWKHSLVQLRLNRAATHVRWSPLETKFAVASGSKTVAICYFAEDNDWWSSKHLKGINSTVLSIDWHPNNVLLAVGSADMKARVYSGYINKLDTKPSGSVWGEKLPFNTLCGEYSNPSGGWIHSVKFSPSGDVLAFLGHDSSLSIVYPASQAVYSVRSSNLPYLTLLFIDENTIVAAGHDCAPYLFKGDESGWELVKVIDDGKLTQTSQVSGIARNMFKTMDKKGLSGADSENDEASLPTVHQNIIKELRAFEVSNNVISLISSIGLDGKLVVWNLN